MAERGEAYDDGPRGTMAAVFPIDLEELEGVVKKARAKGIVEVVNINSPMQQVIAGEQQAVLGCDVDGDRRSRPGRGYFAPKTRP